MLFLAPPPFYQLEQAVQILTIVYKRQNGTVRQINNPLLVKFICRVSSYLHI